MSKYKQGKYVPKHPEKYVGNNINNIIFRSSWELTVHKFFDTNARVLRWSSESIAIPYVKPTDNRVHHYFPDYWVEYIDKDGQIIQEIIEVKPIAQTKPPTRAHKHVLYEQLQYAVNQSKWAAAALWCKQHGMIFRIVSENSIFA